MSGNKTWVIIIESNPKDRALLKDLLIKDKRIEVVGSYACTEDTIKEVLTKAPGLIFMDIILTKNNEFCFLTDLENLHFKPFIIFTGCCCQEAIEAIRYCAFDFLLKPIDPIDLKNVITRYLSFSSRCTLYDKIDILLQQLNSNSRIQFNTRQGFILVNSHDIIFCQADWNYTDVFFGKEKKLSVTSNIGKVEGFLPRSSFIRINRSIIVNLAYVEKINRSNRTIHIKHGSEYFVFKISLSGMNVLNKLSF